MKKFIQLSFCLFLQLITIQTFGQNAVKPVIDDFLIPATSATIGGFVGGKLDASYKNRILAQDANRLVEPFRNRTEDRCWQSEFWGKWFTRQFLPINTDLSLN